MEQEQEVGYWEMSEEEYHASPRISHHKLQDFRESVPRFYGEHVTKTLPGPGQTAAMALGQALHCCVLEPVKFGNSYVVPPRCDKRTKAGKAAWAQFLDNTKAFDLRHIDEDDYRLVAGMQAGILANPWAKGVLAAQGRVEQALRWTDPATGLAMRARMDKLTDTLLIVDVKTTDDVRPTAWPWTVRKYGYHRQAALYLDGLLAAGIPGAETAEFLFVAVAKQSPHECACYMLDEAFLLQGREDNATALAELARRNESGDWSSPWHQEVWLTAPPARAARESVPY